ncbi:D-glycero-beta-D-manno-heptose-7-phosphate kinase [Heliobacterium gestii]|uniref:Bifunctional protein HldE n=1 Tax=Heliomicrobium gestii TaxID=2699 RepID=A0A845LEG5_HELGE|nr:D-glycero-beta-D-manno-heptose-7-phosphate kinase [Heliomicrobium gestii]MBM7866701.1 D-beta-D-heptose 7-phosphate kinase/D-beta-D-heptose 1-phosphate adenosyltransferase [Heliomicrobium gestii]MZP43019.1 D-glycero-beta-D-manno-heptose-7-phosphate kinase [Heliomicrobium gestii]
MVDEKAKLLRLFSESTPRTIAVIGDVMLDRYFFGDVRRISPEAPVPVVNVERMEETLGGAANVALNLLKLGSVVWMAGAVGDDADGAKLLAALQSADIDITGMVKSKKPTITKARVVGGAQQMVRLDFEQTTPIESGEAQVILDWLAGLLCRQSIDAVLISDYAKGTCTPELCQSLIALCRPKGIPVLVDPKGHDWHKYRGADYVTPNVKELGDAYGIALPNRDDCLVQYGAGAVREFGVDNLLITRSEKGMTIIGPEGVHHIPTQAREVYDVSGAGDTVIATTAWAIASGASFPEAATLANMAAGMVIAKRGTYAISRQELVDRLLNEETAAEAAAGSVGDKVLTREEAERRVQQWKAAQLRVVFTNGCFDIVHRGHIAYLEKARRLGDRLIIGLNSDRSVSRIKGDKRPLIAEGDRAWLLAALQFVDAVVLFDEDTPQELIKRLRPDFLVKGGDYSVETVSGREYAGETVILPYEDGCSTTNIIKKILEVYGTHERYKAEA